VADRGALTAAVAAARAHGLRITDPVVLRNVLSGPGGPLWNDWEDTCLGPVGWDVGCLLATGERARGQLALAAAGIELDPAELACGSRRGRSRAPSGAHSSAASTLSRP
jgi:hypothetical protein